MIHSKLNVDWFGFVWLRNSRAAGMRLLDVFDVDIFNLAMSERLEAVLWLFRIDNLFRSFLNEGSLSKHSQFINQQNIKKIKFGKFTRSLLEPMLPLVLDCVAAVGTIVSIILLDIDVVLVLVSKRKIWWRILKKYIQLSIETNKQKLIRSESCNQ